MAISTKRPAANTIPVVDENGNTVFKPITVEPVPLYVDHVGTFLPSWDEHTAYCRVHQYTKGQFAISSNTLNTLLKKCRMAIVPFQVDQDTGAMTFGTMGFGYQNNVGFAHSAQSFGFCGNVGMAWGKAPWGSVTTEYAGGCWWRVNDNNTVTTGTTTGNNVYAGENTGNGMLALYELGSSTYCNIPHGAYASIGKVATNTAGIQDWPSVNEFNAAGGTCYIWRCVGAQVGKGLAGVLCNMNGAIAMNAEGANGTVGSYVPTAQTGDGIGFELSSGKELYFGKGNQAFVRASRTGTLAAAVVNFDGDIFTLDGFLGTLKERATSGYPAKEIDTFYFASGPRSLCKFKIVETAADTFTVTVLGSVDFTKYTTTSLNVYHGLMDVTGNDDKFLVVSVRTASYSPSHTMIFTNPLKDA